MLVEPLTAVPIILNTQYTNDIILKIIPTIPRVLLPGSTFPALISCCDKIEQIKPGIPAIAQQKKPINPHTKPVIAFCP